MKENEDNSDIAIINAIGTAIDWGITITNEEYQLYTDALKRSEEKSKNLRSRVNPAP